MIDLPPLVAYFLRQESSPPMWDQVNDRYKDDADVFALFTADQLRSYARQAVNEALEAAAKKCDKLRMGSPGWQGEGCPVLYSGDCAAAIRSMKEPT